MKDVPKKEVRFFVVNVCFPLLLLVMLLLLL